MAATYVQPTKAEFDDLLIPLGFRVMTVTGTREIVYGRRQDVDGMCLSLRVYSSLEPSGDGRGCGKDAIRINLWTRYTLRNEEGEEEVVRKVGGAKRVNRTDGWQQRLLERIEKWDEVRKCSCGLPMAIRKGKNGEFFGCTGYPNCSNTQKS